MEVMMTGIYFNQFGYANEELFKSTLVIGAQPGDVDENGTPFAPGAAILCLRNGWDLGAKPKLTEFSQV